MALGLLMMSLAIIQGSQGIQTVLYVAIGGGLISFLGFFSR